MLAPHRGARQPVPVVPVIARRERVKLIPVLDTLSVAQRLAAGGIDRDQAEVIADAIRQAVEQGDYVTSDQFKAGMAELRAEIANLDVRLSKQIAELRTEQRTQTAELRTEQRTQAAELRTEIASLETRLVRWMIGTVIATATLTVAIVRLMG